VLGFDKLIQANDINRIDKSETNRYKRAAYIIAVFGAAAILGAPSLYWLYMSHGGGISKDASDWSTFGAFFNGVAGTIIAFGTLVAVAVTFHLQAKELAESRSLITTQAFESNFYQLLRRFGEHVASLRYGGEAVRGRAVIELFHSQIKFNFLNDPSSGDRTRAAYDKFYEETEGPVGVYFRTLYHVFKLIDDGRLTPQQERKYASIARAQLSAHELCLLFYNCMAGEGSEGFKPLVEKYALFKHLNKALLVDPKRADDPALFARRAFKAPGR
jgi:Putative phage abortive infection protein